MHREQEGGGERLDSRGGGAVASGPASGSPTSRLRGLAEGLVAWRWVIALNLFFLSPVLLYNLDVSEAGRLDPVAVWCLLISVGWLATFQILSRRPLVFCLATLPLAFVVLAELFLVVQFDARLTTSYLNVIVYNLSDAPEFVEAFLPQLAVGMGLFLPLYALTVWRVRGLELPLRRAWAAVPLAGVLLLYGAAAARQASDPEVDVDRALLDVVTHDVNSPFGVISQSYVTYLLHEETQALFAAHEDRRFEATRPAPPERPELYVLVIGETSRPDHWGLNGYERDTTPLLGARPELVSFRDVITQSPSTSESVPLMITPATADVGPTGWAAEKSLITAFSEVGFRTYWFSTPEVSHWAGFIHHYAGEADVRRYFERRHDAALLEPLEEVLVGVEAPDDKALVVLHTMGSHFAFANRYPASFARFSKEPPRNRREYLVNTYDDSVRYTDYVLDQVIQRLEDRPDVVSTLFYVADHGENLLDDERELFGHAIGNRYDLPVAQVFWPSPAFRALRPEAVAAARANSSRRLSTGNVFHSLLDLAGIRAARIDPSLSVFRPDLRDAPRVFTARGELGDYDRLYGQPGRELGSAAEPAEVASDAGPTEALGDGAAAADGATAPATAAEAAEAATEPATATEAADGTTEPATAAEPVDGTTGPPTAAEPAEETTEPLTAAEPADAAPLADHPELGQGPRDRAPTGEDRSLGGPPASSPLLGSARSAE